MSKIVYYESHRVLDGCVCMRTDCGDQYEYGEIHRTAVPKGAKIYTDWKCESYVIAGQKSKK